VYVAVKAPTNPSPDQASNVIAAAVEAAPERGPSKAEGGGVNDIDNIKGAVHAAMRTEGTYRPPRILAAVTGIAMLQGFVGLFTFSMGA
jgi:hypothetical protein